MTGPLAFSPTPFSIDLGPAGKTYVTGVLSGLGLVQTNPLPGDKNGQIDVSNAQIMIQKTDGLVQYYVQAGAYSIPALGTAYITAGKANSDFFGPVPQAFIKLAPTSNFSIEGGKLPTLIGAEYTFSFENMNIERGLLWNQEPAVSRGVQFNYTAGPVAFSVSFNDGYYSDVFNWISGSATWTINSANTLVFAAGGNAGSTGVSTIATPLAQNNSSIYDVIFTHTAGPWTITPYVQWSHVPKNVGLGFQHDAWTYGAAVLANYAFNPHFSLAGRIEYIGSTGSLSEGAPNLLYGPGSKAMSLTLTPTYQFNRFFVRGDVSYVALFNAIDGLALGPDLNKTSQVRGLIETGVLF
jgi:Putative beta-barrel porin-2, OmpL-like. bbp2